MSPFNTGLSKEQLSAMGGNISRSDRTSLPFTAPTLWWKNGDNRLATLAKTPSAVLYFGGWGVDRSDMENAADEYSGIPRGWQLAERIVNAKNELYDAYFSRVALVAPILRRSRWFQVRGDRGGPVIGPNGKPKSYSVVNYLAMLAMPSAEKGGKPEYWGMVVLKGTSNSGLALDNAIQEWAKQTASLRLKYAEETPAQFFWAPVGTFGDAPVVELKGKGENRSPINPAQVFIPPAEKVKDWSAYFEKAFVGEDLASVMVDAADNAREWADEWNKHRDDAGDSAPQGNASAPQAGKPTQGRPTQGNTQAEEEEFPF